MDAYVVCPRCGARIQPEATICLARLLAIRCRAAAPIGEVTAPDFRTQLPFQCPACREPLSYPLDAPLAVA